jgi:hypothetical protein
LPGTGFAVGICDCDADERDGLGEGFDFSATEAGEDFGRGLGRTVVPGGFCVVLVRRCVLVGAGVTLLPGVVTASDATVVVVVVVVSVFPLM